MKKPLTLTVFKTEIRDPWKNEIPVAAHTMIWAPEPCEGGAAKFDYPWEAAAIGSIAADVVKDLVDKSIGGEAQWAEGTRVGCFGPAPLYVGAWDTTKWEGLADHLGEDLTAKQLRKGHCIGVAPLVTAEGACPTYTDPRMDNGIDGSDRLVTEIQLWANLQYLEGPHYELDGWTIVRDGKWYEPNDKALLV